MTTSLSTFVPEGRLRAIAASSAFLVAAALAWGLFGADAPRAAAELAASWLFFAGAPAGAIALGAILELTGATWGRPLDRAAARLARYLPVAAALAAVVAIVNARARHLGDADAAFLIAREVVGSAALFGLGLVTLRREPGRRPAWLLIGYCLVLGVVGSMWAFDYEVLPSPGFSSTLAGPHLFVGAFVSGVGFTVIGALRARALDAHQQRDAASLVLALSIFWAYLFWSQLLTLWYGNLPDETAFLAARAGHGWEIVTLLVVGSTLAVPFALLLSGPGKRSSRVVCVAAGAQLVGLWLERQLLVVPAADGAAGPLDPVGAVLQLGMAALFVASTWPPWSGLSDARDPIAVLGVAAVERP